jgi:hypothetical protein
MKRHENGGFDGGGTTTRRTFLAAGGAVALASVAGCAAIEGLIDDASEEAVGATTASPAAFYAGHATPAGSDGDDGSVLAYGSGPGDVRYVPATVRAESRTVDLEGWAVATGTKAQDYNSSRSNKAPTAWWDTGGDSDADGIEILLDAERALSIHVDAAIEAVASRSRDDSETRLAAIASGIEDVQAVLEDGSCTTETCVTLRENAGVRKSEVETATAAVEAGEWDRASESLRTVQRIVEGDVARLEGDLDSDDDGLPDGTEPAYEYLDGEPTVGERFVVSLPDARLPGGGPSLAGELTPRRVLDYFTGVRDGDGCTDTDGAVVVHRDLACRTLLPTELTAADPDRRAVVAFEADGGTVVTGATPTAEGAAPALSVAADGTARPTETLESWGSERESDGSAATPVVVRPVLARPEGCDCPIPALFYVGRIRHDGQYLYAGGWAIDEGALYEDAATLLVATGPSEVVGVARSEFEGGAPDLRAAVEKRKRPGRTKYGNITLKASYDPDADYYPPGMRSACAKKGYDYWQAQSRAALAAGTGDCDDSDDDRRPTTGVVTALDAPVLHLVDAATASSDVKFKAGAELSKAVN